MILKVLIILAFGYIACGIMVEIAWNEIVRKLPMSGINFQEMTFDKACDVTLAVFAIGFVVWVFNIIMDKIISKQ